MNDRRVPGGKGWRSVRAWPMASYLVLAGTDNDYSMTQNGTAPQGAPHVDRCPPAPPLRARRSAGSLGGLSSILAHAQAPAVVTPERARPGFPSGVQSGDVTSDRGIVWARADRPARMWVEWATTQELRQRAPHARAVRAGSHRPHGPHRSRRAARGPGHLLSRAMGGPRRRRPVASRCRATSAPRRRAAARRALRLVRRHRRPGLGHRRRSGAA